MKHINMRGYKGLALMLSLLLMGCTISYKFNGASINYDIIKTISLESFPNRAVYQWGPMESMFNNALSDIYANQTKLQQVARGGDLSLSGEITSYDQVNKSISSDGYSSMMQLKMTVNVRFENTKNHSEDFERQFSASREFDTSQQLNDVQEELVNQMIDEIVEQIFNATVANW
ncbi:MAG: LptE family protein [Bacteroidaceae bacterium]|nr:LptE family protein [Bacteroidaceae bacterium]